MLNPLLRSIVRALSFGVAKSNTFRHLSYIEGLEFVPKTGPVMIVPNHRSYFDHYLVAFTVSAVRTSPTWFLTKKESFQRFFRRVWTEAWYGIPVDRENIQADTLRAVKHAFANGHAVCIYPEGTRNVGEGLLPFKDGAFRLAASHGVPVLPVYIRGSADVLPIGKTSFTRAKAGITFGNLLLPPSDLPKNEAANWLRDESKNWMSLQETLIRPKGSDITAASLHNFLDHIAVHEKKTSLTHAMKITALVRLIFNSGHDGSAKAELFARLAGLLFLYGSRALKPFSFVWTALAMEDLRRKQASTFWSQYLLGRWDSARPFVGPKSKEMVIEKLKQAQSLDSENSMRATKALAEHYIALGDYARALPYLSDLVKSPLTTHSDGNRVTWAEEWIDRIRLDVY